MEPKRNHGKPLMQHKICSHKIFLTQKNINNSMYSERRDRAILLKYFPKHIADLHFKFSDGTLNTRIKRLKLVKNFSCEETPHPNFWRLVIANKNKTVQSLIKQEDIENEQYTKLNFQFLKMLPKLKKLKLGQKRFETISLGELHWMQRSCCYLNHLHNLEYMHIYVPSQDIFLLLSKLKYPQRILSHLKTFHVGCLWPDNENHTILQTFLTFKEEILKHLTHLTLGTLADQGFFEAFQLLSNYYPRLCFLFFRTSSTSSLEEITFLKSLKNFHSLQKLHFCTEQELDLFKHCIFPKSLRHLKLILRDIDWEKMYNDPSSLVAFPSQPENLQNLEALELLLYDLPQDEESLNNFRLGIEIFLQDLLKKIPTCRVLTLTFRSLVGGLVFPFHFSQFLKSIEHLGQSLAVLDISAKRCSLHFDDFKIQQDIFPQLSKLSLLMKISPEIEFENIFNLVSPQEPDSSIKLGKVTVESCEALLKLLLRLGGIKNIADEKRIELTISLENLEADREYFTKNYNDVKGKIGIVKNIVLLIEPTEYDIGIETELQSLLSLFGDSKTC